MSYRVGASIVWLLLLLALAAAGCSRSTLESAYGRRRGVIGGPSVNGTAVLAGMFRDAGYRVTSANRLSGRLDTADVLVWTPDRFGPPTLAEVTYLERWLNARDDRTLVYIGRDYDAAPQYWRQMLPNAPAEQVPETYRRLAHEQSLHDIRRLEAPASYVGRWFTLDRDAPRRTVRSLSGPWSEGVDDTQVDITLASRLRPSEFIDILHRNTARTKKAAANANPATSATPVGPPTTTKKAPSSQGKRPSGKANSTNTTQTAAGGGTAVSSDELYVEDAQEWSELEELQEELDYSVDFSAVPQSTVLLESGPDILAYRLASDQLGSGSQILVVNNGSFLLNLPLVNKEHRKLAGHLIRQCHGGERVIFLECGPHPMAISDAEPDDTVGLRMFMVWPLNIIMAHLVALGMLFLVSVFPIFGRPHELEDSAPSDFGKHIRALGELLERTGDVQYARSRLSYYHEHVRRESGSGQLASPPAAISPVEVGGASENVEEEVPNLTGKE